jgi:hypothetical protein
LSAKVKSPMALTLSQAAYRFKLGRNRTLAEDAMVVELLPEPLDHVRHLGRRRVVSSGIAISNGPGS